MLNSVKAAVLRGFLCINKGSGATSRDAVNVIQRLVRPHKVGHAGTLDPLATGVLVVAVGKATRLIQFVQQMPKTYLGTFELGKTSDTEDITGDVVLRDVERLPTREEVQQAIRPLVGDILQRPPNFSALRVNGKRAYSRAREGEQFELAARPIVVHEMEIVRYEYPSLQLRIVCGSGTYVRSLGRDIGEGLGCGAVMTALVRTSIGSFRLENSSQVDDFIDEEAVEQALLPVEKGVLGVPRVAVEASQIRALSFGQKLVLPSEAEQLAAIDETGSLIAVLVRSGDLYRPAVNFVAT